VAATNQTGNTVTYRHGINDVTFTLTDTHSGTTGPLVLTDAQRSSFASAFTINAQTGVYTFNLPSPDYLDPGQTVTANYAVGVANQNGEATTTNVAITVNGTAENGPVGTAGDDILNGGAFGDLISGGGGDDIINGNAGNDILRGGSGDDYLRGGTGFNTIDGGSGTDTGVLEHNQNEYFVSYTNGNDASGGITMQHFASNGVADEVHQFVNVELFQFADGSIIPATSIFGNPN
jgi:Ca2+-binding RTX toxin-like protein